MARRLITTNNHDNRTNNQRMMEEIQIESYVEGYFPEWRQVRVTINRFGKRTTTNRQFVVAFKGNQSNAPRDFVEDSIAYRFLVICKKGEEMLEPYAPIPDYASRSTMPIYEKMLVGEKISSLGPRGFRLILQSILIFCLQIIKTGVSLSSY